MEVTAATHSSYGKMKTATCCIHRIMKPLRIRWFMWFRAYSYQINKTPLFWAKRSRKHPLFLSKIWLFHATLTPSPFSTEKMHLSKVRCYSYQFKCDLIKCYNDEAYMLWLVWMPLHSVCIKWINNKTFNIISLFDSDRSHWSDFYLSNNQSGGHDQIQCHWASQDQ